MSDQPGLFDLVVPEVPNPARSGRGRARETYARTVVADVTVADRQALQAAALSMLDTGIVVTGESSDEPDDPPDPREEIATSDAAAVQWCLEPTAGMELLLESGVVRILSIELGCDDASVTDTRVRARWTVTVKIQDAHAAREMALAACPVTDAAARMEIERSFAAVWHWTAPPYAPMARIAGVSWTPVDVGALYGFGVRRLLIEARAAA